MKKILCSAMLMIAMIASATAQMKAYSPPEQDIGYELVATLSVDGQAVVSFDSQWNIVDLQTPVMLNMEVSAPSAQVVDAYSAQTPMGEISMTLASYMWPYSKNETMNLRNDYTSDYASTGADIYSFMASRTAHT
jgi:hypothetical protein